VPRAGRTHGKQLQKLKRIQYQSALQAHPKGVPSLQQLPHLYTAGVPLRLRENWRFRVTRTSSSLPALGVPGHRHLCSESPHWGIRGRAGPWLSAASEVPGCCCSPCWPPSQGSPVTYPAQVAHQAQDPASHDSCAGWLLPLHSVSGVLRPETNSELDPASTVLTSWPLTGDDRRLASVPVPMLESKSGESQRVAPRGAE